MSLRQQLFRFTLGFCLFLTTVSLSAQVNLSGNVSDGVGGPLLSGTVYHATGNLTVPLGTTLTVQSGAIIKFGVAQTLTVNGLLDVTASVGPMVIMTAINDDSAGGDTNANGPTVGAPGFWRGIDIGSSGVVNLNGLEMRFTGQSNLSAIDLSTTPGSSLTNCIIRDYLGNGVDYGTSGLATITGCQFLNGTIPVVGCPIRALPTFTNNSASGNSVNNSVNVVSGSISENVTIPANSMMGGAHVLTGNLSLNAGFTLTLDAGVILKVQAVALTITVNGQLLSNGTGANPVVFTVYADDDHGGDTNNNGLSAGAPGFWRGLQFNDSSDGSNLQDTIIRYTGQSTISAVELFDADITLTSCRIENCFAAGIDLNGNSSLPIISNCHIDGVTVPIHNASWVSLPNFSNNTTANISGTDAVVVTEGVLTANVSLVPANLINSVVAHLSNLTIPVGLTLTLNAGVIYKTGVAASTITVQGTLDCQGSGGNEVVFTTILDDSHGGDTNANGPSSGAPGFWRGLNFGATSGASQLTSTRVRFCGQSNLPGITINAAAIQLTNCVIEDCFAEGISLANSVAMPTITGCAIDRCTIAIDNVRLPAIPGFTSNTASGNSVRNSIRVSGSVLSVPVSVTKNNLINDVLEFTGNQGIGASGSLTLAQGVVVKLATAASQMVVDGTLIANGTVSEPVVFTSILDDSHAGDTNLDAGATVANPGFWRGIQFNSGSDASLLNHSILRYSGQSNISGIEIFGSSLTLTDCSITDCLAAALDFNSTASIPTIRNCAFNNNARSVQGARWDNLVNFLDNTASGNSVFDSPMIESGSVPIATDVQARSMINGCFIVTSQPTISASSVLRFHRGCIVKVIGVLTIGAGSGDLEVLGTGSEPVVFTVIADDDYAGDTNKNGPSTGIPGQSRGLTLTNVGPSRIEYAIVRFAGQASTAGVQVSSNMVSIKSVRVERCFADGFNFASTSLGADLDNLVAFSCGGIGIDMNQSTQDLRFATATACGTGIRLGGSFLGTVDGCIAFGNTTNYVGTTAGNLFNSNGDAALAGMNGNINADPLFVDSSVAVGDLRLQITSPCIDAANFGLGMTVAADHLESSRLNDHDFDGNVGCDMGAFEFSNYSMEIAGEPRLGQTLLFTLTGVPGIGQICTALLDGTSYMSPFGMVLVGTPATVLLEDLVYEGYGYPIMVPNNPQFVGIEFGVQMGGAALGDTTTGNITNLYRGVVQD